jgi:hypothetical protein
VFLPYHFFNLKSERLLQYFQLPDKNYRKVRGISETFPGISKFLLIYWPISRGIPNDVAKDAIPSRYINKIPVWNTGVMMRTGQTTVLGKKFHFDYPWIKAGYLR